MALKPQKRNTTGQRKRKEKDYLEIYIREDGNVLMTPVTVSTMSVFKKLSTLQTAAPSEYCG